MTALASRPSSIGWRFWVAWMLATTMAAIAFLVVVWPVNSMMGPAGPLGGTTPPGPRGAAVWIEGILMGAVLGLGQWLVLRKYLPGSGWWVLATAIGYLLSGLVGRLLPIGLSNLQSVLLPLESGIALGISQWVVLRQRLNQAGWWIVFSITGWALGFGLTPAMYLARVYIEPMDIVFVFFVPIAVTGVGMAWLLRLTMQHGGVSTGKTLPPAPVS